MTLSTQIERGVMVMKNGKAWGTDYADGYSTSYGWIDPAKAPLHDPQYCTKPTDVTYRNSPYTPELRTGRLILVIRTTTVQMIKELK